MKSIEDNDLVDEYIEDNDLVDDSIEDSVLVDESIKDNVLVDGFRRRLREDRNRHGEYFMSVLFK